MATPIPAGSCLQDTIL